MPGAVGLVFGDRFASAKRWVVGALRAVKAWIGLEVRVNGFEAAGGRALR